MESTPRAVRTLSQLYCSPAARAASGVCWRFSPCYQGSYVAQHWWLLGERNGQRHSDSSCGRNSGGCRGCDTTFQDEEESSPLECRKRDVCWRFQEQTNAPLIIPASGQVPGRRSPPQREVCVP